MPTFWQRLRTIQLWLRANRMIVGVIALMVLDPVFICGYAIWYYQGNPKPRVSIYAPLGGFAVANGDYVRNTKKEGRTSKYPYGLLEVANVTKTSFELCEFRDGQLRSIGVFNSWDLLEVWNDSHFTVIIEVDQPQIHTNVRREFRGSADPEIQVVADIPRSVGAGLDPE